MKKFIFTFIALMSILFSVSSCKCTTKQVTKDVVVESIDSTNVVVDTVAVDTVMVDSVKCDM